MVLWHGKKRMTPGGFAVEDGGALPFYRGRGGLGQRSVDKVKEWPVLMGMKWLPLNWRGMQCGARGSAPMASEAGAVLEGGGGGSLLRCGRRKKGRLGQKAE
jgi:hypothetical protein